MCDPWTRRRFAGSAAALLLAGRTARAATPGETLPLAQVVELTGALSRSGDAWRNGVELAVQEINAAGGLLGKLLQVTTHDAQSTSAGGHAAMRAALEADPLVVLGPARSDPARGALLVPRGRGTPVILGGGAADLTGPAHPATLRAIPSTQAMMARFALWLHDAGKPGRIAILWSGHDPYRTSRDAFVHEARARGLEIAAEWVTPGTDPAADTSRLLKAAPDSLLLLVPEDIAGRAMAEVARQAAPVRLLGGAWLLDPRTLALAGAAAAGARAHVLLPPDQDSGGFPARYAAANKQPPREQALAGYLAVGMVKAALEKAGTADPRALAEALRDLSVTAADQPMLLGDCTWNANGDPDRQSFVVEVRDGSPHTVTALRDAGQAK